ncbi:MAG TPA: hypothetical protein VN965_07245, partial [Candidatus Dormibacteraeota bacterium]|nr:hypothetical protein [Candidatus Dormibacteraeota bacterium]
MKALEKDCEEGVAGGLGGLKMGLGVGAFCAIFDSILLTNERMFGSLFLCSRRKTCSLRPALSWPLSSFQGATRRLPKSFGEYSTRGIFWTFALLALR